MVKIRDHAKMENRRLKSVKLFEKGKSAPEVAQRLGVARQVAYRWKAFWMEGGVEALASKGNAGRKPKLSSRQFEAVAQALLEGPEQQGYKTNLWTLPRVAILIKDMTGVSYHPGHVWKLLEAAGFSCQRPERRALERDEKEVRHWMRVKWPWLKKKPAKKAEPSSSSTKAA